MAWHSNILETFLGHHLDHATHELNDDEPDDMTLVRIFCEVLDGVHAIVHSSPAVMHRDDGVGCDCTKFIFEQLHHVTTMEKGISDWLGRQVITDESKCWLAQMEDKYALLEQLLMRQEQDYIDFAEGGAN